MEHRPSCLYQGVVDNYMDIHKTPTAHRFGNEKEKEGLQPTSRRDFMTFNVNAKIQNQETDSIYD